MALQNRTLWLKAGLFIQFKGDHQEIVFPFPFVNVVSKVPVKRHLL